VSHNNFLDTFEAADAADLVDTSYEFSHNRVVGAMLGVDIWNASLPAHVRSTYLITNNRFLTQWVGVSSNKTWAREAAP